MDSLKQRKPILFETELSHTKCYLDIEKQRFGGRVNIVENFDIIDFHMPLLTLQPIVENAVGYGVTKQK